jgi:hypothetical protein
LCGAEGLALAANNQSQASWGKHLWAIFRSVT